MRPLHTGPATIVKRCVSCLTEYAPRRSLQRDTGAGQLRTDFHERTEIMLATEYAQYYQIEAQREGESDVDFRSRVSGALRDKGNIIEAHEVYQDKRYENSDRTMTGIVGAAAQALQGVSYGSSGERQVGDDIAAGVVSRAPKDDPAMLLLAALLLGREW